MKTSKFAPTKIIALILLLLVGIFRPTHAAPGDVDLSFDPGSGVNGLVRAVAVQADGKMLIAGDFTTVDGMARPGLARLEANGHGDVTFNPATSFTNVLIVDIAPQSDGNIFICGAYRSPQNLWYEGKAFAVRLNSTGTVQTPVFANPESDFYGSSYSTVAVQSDGKVVIGGYFVDAYPDGEGGIVLFPRGRIVRQNPNGTADTSFSFTEEAGGAPVSSVVVLPDGKLLAAYPSSAGGIARLNSNGALDSSFNAPSSGVSSDTDSITSIVLQGDGKVLIGGDFHGSQRTGIARLNANGSLDPSFNPGTGALAVDSVVLQPDGKVVIGGRFTSVNGVNRNRIARLNADGSLDSSFNPGTGADGTVYSMALQSDGNILIGGDFSTVNGVVRPRVARLQGDTVPTSGTFANTNNIPISDPTQPGRIGRGTPYPSTINVSGFAASDAIQKITVTLHNLAHELVDDVDVLLVGPGGQNLVLFSDAGGRQEPPAAVTITLDDAAASEVPDEGPLVSGTYRPSNFESADVFPSPAPPPSAATTLATFAGTNPNGEWKLYVVDDDVFDAGSILNGWSITIQTITAPPPLSFTSWVGGFALSASDAGADADPDGDGLANAVEYILGGNPAQPAASPRPVLSLTGGNMVFTFPRVDLSEAADATITVEASPDLMTWPTVFTIGPDTAGSSPGVTVAENGAGPDTITVTIPQGAAPRMFARLKVLISL